MYKKNNKHMHWPALPKSPATPVGRYSATPVLGDAGGPIPPATLVGMAAPQLIYPLSCMFNRQIGLPSRVLLKLNKDFYLCEDFEQVRPTVISCVY